MKQQEGYLSRKYDTRASEWIGDLAAWHLRYDPTNAEQIERVKRNLAAAIRKELTPYQQRAVRMYFLDGLNMREIAAELGVCVPTVSRTLKRAKTRLQKVLEYSF